MREEREQQSELEEDEEPVYSMVDFLNKDLDLLFIVILLEGFKEGRTTFRLTDFFKGNYWSIEDVKEEILGSNDYGGISDMVLEQVIFLFEQLRLGTIEGIGVDDVDAALVSFLQHVAELGSEEVKAQSEGLAWCVKQIVFIDDLRREKIEREAERNPDSIAELLKEPSVFFTKEEGYFRKLQSIVVDIPEHILLKFRFDEQRMNQLADKVRQHLDEFSKDRHVDRSSMYRKQRPYFSQQVENIYRYLSNLKPVGKTFNIPFSILTEKGFEAVKLLELFELRGVLRMRWSDEGSWRAEFVDAPMTLDGLFGARPSMGNTQRVISDLKIVLRYDSSTSVLSVGEKRIKIIGADQKELLGIIFNEHGGNAHKNWQLSEIAEIYEPDEPPKDKKFYNASRQIIKRVAQETSIKDLLITTTHTIQINPKYSAES